MQEKKGEVFLSPEIAKLAEKLQKDPSSKLFFPLAEEYIKCSMLEEAIMVLTDGLKIHPGFHAARVSLGKVYLQKGRVAEAKAEFEKVAAQNPDNLMAQKKLALIYRDEGSIEKAKQICNIILLTNVKDLEMRKLLSELEKHQVKPPAGPEAAAPAAQPQTMEASNQSKTVPDVASSIVRQEAAFIPSEKAFTEAKPAPPLGEPIQPDSLEKPGERVSSVEASLERGSVPGLDVLQSPVEKAGPPQPMYEGLPLIEPSPSPSSVQERPEASEKAVKKAMPGAGEEERNVPVIELNVEEAGGGINEEDIFGELLGTSPPQSGRPAAQESSPFQNAVPVEPSPSTEGPALEGDLATSTIAELYIKQGHYEQGIEVYRKILEHNPDNEEVRQRLEDALALANLLTKRPREGRSPVSPSKDQEAASPPSSSEQRVIKTPDQLRQAKVQRLQAWLDQLRRSQNP